MSAIPAISTSDCPTPTVSTSTTSKPSRVQHPQRLRRRPGQSTQMTARRHRADEDPGVGRVVLHPHPVTQQRATGERRRRIDRQYADPLARCPVRRDERRRGGRLAHAGRSGDPDDVRPAGVRRERGHHLAQQRRLVLDERDEPCDCPRVAVAGSLDQFGDRGSPSWHRLSVSSGTGGKNVSSSAGRGRSGRHPGRHRHTGRPRRYRHRGAGAPAPGEARAGRPTCRSGGRARSRRR